MSRTPESCCAFVAPSAAVIGGEACCAARPIRVPGAGAAPACRRHGFGQ